MPKHSTLDHIKQLLRDNRLRPKDFYGQNFMADEDVLDQIIEAADLKSTDTVLEVGPGLGFLTKRLAQKAELVLAVEKDRLLLNALKRELKSSKNVKVVNDDILKYNIPKNLPKGFKVVANIPYYLTSKLIYDLLHLKDKPKLMVLMLQKEVAERIVAQPGDLSVLGISVQFYADAKIIVHVPKDKFYPSPEIDSAVIKIEPQDKYPDIDEKVFFRLIKIGFAGKRKQIHNSLANGLHLPKNEVSKMLQDVGLDPNIRAQDMTIEDWLEVYEAVAALGEGK